MSYDPERHHRRSIRLPDYDYRQDGAYFLTICTQGRKCLFGDISDDEMLPNTLGCIVEEEWERTPIIRPKVKLDVYVVMPNHFHAIVWLVNNLPEVGTDNGDERRAEQLFSPTTDRLRTKPRSLSTGGRI